MSDPTTPKRKKRRPSTTDVGRQLLQRERQRLAREQAALGEALANEAHRAMSLREAPMRARHVTAEHVAISRGIVRRVAGVLASEHVCVPIEVRPTGDVLSAYTDFERIHASYRVQDDPRMTAAVLRGILYHEGGHIRWTMPWPTLAEVVKRDHPQVFGTASWQNFHRAWNILEDQRMETAVVSDSPRKAAYFTPMILAEFVSTKDNAAANYPVLAWRKYLPRHIRTGARALFIVRHQDIPNIEALVDHMESLIERYVTATDPTTMVTAVIEFHNVMQNFRPLAVNMDDAGHSRHRRRPAPPDMDDFLTIPISPDMLDESFQDDADDDDTSDEDVEDDFPMSSDDLAPDQIEHLIDVLIAAWWAPETLVAVRYVIQGSESQEGEGSSGGGDIMDEPQDGAGSKGSDDEADEDDDEDDDTITEPAPSKGGSKDDEDDADDDTDDDEAGDAYGDDDDDFDDTDEDDDDGGQGAGGGHHEDDDEGIEAPEKDDVLTDEDLAEALEEAEAERDNQRELDADVEAYKDALDNRTSSLDAYVGGVSDDIMAIAVADNLAEDIERAFQRNTIDRAPAWVEGQRRGIINVLRYQTRQPGDSEFFRQWTEDDAPGFDIAVSLLLDYSGSMSGDVERLAQVAYASKLACQNLGIPCTVTLWDDNARTLFDATEQVESMPVIRTAGGTNPEVALADLDNQRHDKAKHIVLIMSDGEWESAWEGKSKRTLALYKDASRRIIGFGYGHDGIARRLLGYGCDEAFAIQDLMAIPRFLEDALVAMA
jgi:hypothetical protein